MRDSDLISTVVLIDRIPVILADTMLVVITWKLLPESSIVNHDTQGNTPKTKGLASILVQNGLSALVSIIIPAHPGSTILEGMMYFM